MTTMRSDDMADRQTSSPNQTCVAAAGSHANKPPRRHAAASRSQAPQVTTETDEGGVTHLRPSTTKDPDEWRAAFLAVFSTDDASVAEYLYQQLLALLRPDPSEPLCARTANLALSLLQALAPQNEVEALLCIQLLGCHLGAVATMQRALRADQPMQADLLRLGRQADADLHPTARRPEPYAGQGDGPAGGGRAGHGRDRRPGRRRRRYPGE
jgi:hypothetical protein